MPAFAQASSMGWPPGAPLKPTDPIASSPIMIEMFFSESTCACADEDAASSAAKPVTRANRIDIDPPLSITRAVHGQSQPRPMPDYATLAERRLLFRIEGCGGVS